MILPWRIEYTQLLTKFLFSPKRAENLLPVPFSRVEPFLHNILVSQKSSELTYENILQTTPLHTQNQVNSVIPFIERFTNFSVFFLKQLCDRDRASIAQVTPIYRWIDHDEFSTFSNTKSICGMVRGFFSINNLFSLQLELLRQIIGLD